MTCAMRLHDPCAGEVRLHKAYGHEVALCWRHGIRLQQRRNRGQKVVPFRWQTDEQLEQWAADRRVEGPGQHHASRGRVAPGYERGR